MAGPDLHANSPQRRLAAAGTILLGLLAAEIAGVFVILLGLVLHVLLLAATLSAAAVVGSRDRLGGQLLLVFALLPLVRIISFSTPLAALSWMQWIVLIGAIFYVAVFGALRVLRPAPIQVRAVFPRLRDLPVEVLVIAAGIPLGIAEYLLIRPGPILADTAPSLLVGPAVLIILFTGVVEELLFRGLLPYVLLPGTGPLASIVIPAAAQAALVAGFLNPAYVALIFAAGLLFGLVAARHQSIFGVGIAHGLANVLLFLLLPLDAVPW